MPQRTNQINQCMGCQAGWPTVEPYSHWPRGLRPYPVFHQVVGGYPYEIVACTKDLYALDQEPNNE